MHAILLFLIVTAVLGTRTASSGHPLPRAVIVACAVLVTLALTSRRVVM